MGLMDILHNAHNGEFFANAGRAAGVDAAAAERILGVLAPAIVVQLRKRAEDGQAFEGLLDLLEDGNGDAFLDDPSLMGDPELVSDGEAVLADIYGSAESARKELGIASDDQAKQRLAAIGASAVLAALARSYNQPLGLVGAQPATSGGGEERGGILSSIMSAVIKGAVQSATRELMPKRRRRRRTSSYFGTRRTRGSKRRRSTTPSLEQIFGELLGGSRN